MCRTGKAVTAAWGIAVRLDGCASLSSADVLNMLITLIWCFHSGSSTAGVGCCGHVTDNTVTRGGGPPRVGIQVTQTEQPSQLQHGLR
jgi:hypothetical protein